jgi:hypothetical protein
MIQTYVKLAEFDAISPAPKQLEIVKCEKRELQITHQGE